MKIAVNAIEAENLVTGERIPIPVVGGGGGSSIDDDNISKTTTYSSDKIESEIGTVKESLTKYINHGVLFDLIPNEYVEQDGRILPYNNWSRTDFIDVSDYDNIYTTWTNTTGYSAWYDENKNFVSKANIYAGEMVKLEIPNDVKYIAISQSTAKMATLEIFAFPIADVRARIKDTESGLINLNSFFVTPNSYDNAKRIINSDISTQDGHVISGYTDGRILMEFNVVGGETYYITQPTISIQKMAIYDSDDHFINTLYNLGFTSFNAEFTMPENAYICRVGYFQESMNPYFGLQKYYGAWLDGKTKLFNSDYIVLPESEDNFIHIGVGTDYPTIKAGLEYAVNNNLGVIIEAGTYDLVAEGISGKGYYMPKEIRGYGAILLCDLPTEDWTLSPLNTVVGSKGHKVYGLTVICSNCRYCIHDEMGNATETQFYHNVYKDCTLIHKSEPTTTLVAPQCIGGGWGDSAFIEIEDCIFNAKIRDVSYHSLSTNSGRPQTGECFVHCSNSVFEHTITCMNIGESTDYMNIIYASSNQFGESPNTTPKANCKIIAWNNEVRT